MSECLSHFFFQGNTRRTYANFTVCKLSYTKSKKTQFAKFLEMKILDHIVSPSEYNLGMFHYKQVRQTRNCLLVRMSCSKANR